METVVLILVFGIIGLLGHVFMDKVSAFLEESIRPVIPSSVVEQEESETIAGEVIMEKKRQKSRQLFPVSGRISHEEGRGHLKIFFSYADGVGKTSAMLQAAAAAKGRGTETVVGYLDPGVRERSLSMLQGMEELPELSVYQQGKKVGEFDLDGAIKRKPALIIIDELAHTNARGCRHAKRYQDVEELLKAGIDVYTTLNVQHIESLNDTVASITGVMEEERIPDSVFDDASRVELVDMEPGELLERNKSEKSNHFADREAASFAVLENLSALRELALRRCADRISTLSVDARVKSGGSYHTDEHILVCLSTAPSNMRIIRTAARMAKAFRGSFTALYVETSDFAAVDEEDKKRLRNNMRLAQQLGAKIETVYGEDVPYQIAEFARLSGVSKVVIGRSTAARKFLVGKPALTEKLIAQAPNLDIYIIPDSGSGRLHRTKTVKQRTRSLLNGKDVLKSIGMLVLSSVIGYVFWKLGLSEANIIMAYILRVLITSVITTRQMYSLISSVVSVIVFNFLFTEPRYTLLAYEKDYPITFITMFVAAFLTGSLAIRLKRQAAQAASSAYRTKILFDTSQLLEGVREREQIITITATQLIKLLNRDMVVYPAKGDGLDAPLFFASSGGQTREEYLTEHEKDVACWVLKNNKHAGATTDTHSEARCLYLSIRTSNAVYGVIGIVIQEKPMDTFENSILLSILGECALALENEKNAREKAQAALLAQKEQLRANLLRSISHDLRTPLTSISGNASNLLSDEERFDEATRRQLYLDIYDDSMWLISLMENLLSITRIEEGSLDIRLSTELLDEVITEALQHVDRKKEEHIISYRPSDDFLLVKVDTRLIMQVIINIVNNAIKYTQEGSEIVITTQKLQDKAVVHIADNGPGIPDDMKPLVFDMFYSGAKSIADSRRSLGLGLALCKSIINVHGGEVTVSDNIPHGAVLTFTLPIEEVRLNE